MPDISTSLLEIAAGLLEPDDRDGVLGDLVEAGETAWQAFCGVLGLLVRRQAMLWKSWRPWASSVGLALPASFLLMGFSVSVSSSFQYLLTDGPVTSGRIQLLVSQLVLLTAWSWTSGFVVGSLSRRTLWVSIASSCLPCLFCLARFRESALPSVCLLLFLAPALWGAWRGWRRARLTLPSSILLALVTTTLMILPAAEHWQGLHWLLLWPAWYLVAAARKEI
jgi:hypothetical protein